MKKALIAIVIAVVAGFLLANGCRDRSIDTAKLQGAFASAAADVKEQIDKGVAAITISNYSAALPPLQHVAYAAKLTKEQRLILETSILKLKDKAGPPQ